MVTLTNGLHQSINLKGSRPIPVKNSWIISFDFKITDSIGISDVDGVGGDGIWFEINSRDGFRVKFDTFKNIENNSGNEVLLYLEDTKVAQGYCKYRFNSGELIQTKIIYLDYIKTVVVWVNDHPILAYAFSDIDLYSVVDKDKPNEVSFHSFTGDAGGKHSIYKFNYKQL